MEDEEEVRAWCRNVSASILSHVERNDVEEFRTGFPWGSASRELLQNTAEVGTQVPNVTPVDLDGLGLNLSSCTYSTGSESSEPESNIANNATVRQRERLRHFFSNHRNLRLADHNARTAAGFIEHQQNRERVYDRVFIHSSTNESPLLNYHIDQIFNDNEGKSTSDTRIRYGNRSFEPKANFDNAPKAYPAKPDISGFSPCHEKALAACSVFQSIQNENSDEDDLTSNADIFSHFWVETNVVRWEDEPSNSQSQTQEFSISHMPELQESENGSIDAIQQAENNNVDDNPDYEQWDNETSIINNPLNYDLWNDLSGGIRTFDNFSSDQFIGTRLRSASVGVGTSTTGTCTTTSNSSFMNIPERSSIGNYWPTITERIGVSRRFSSNPSLTAQRDFLRTFNFGPPNESGDSDADFREFFNLDQCDVPETIGNEIPPDEVPRSFFENDCSGGDGQINFESMDFKLKSLEHEDSDKEHEDENGSVFRRVPEVDNTPSSLWKELGAIALKWKDEIPRDQTDEDFLSFSHDLADSFILDAVQFKKLVDYNQTNIESQEKSTTVADCEEKVDGQTSILENINLKESSHSEVDNPSIQNEI